MCACEKKINRKDKLSYVLQFFFFVTKGKVAKNRSIVAMHLMVPAHVPMVTSRSHSHSAEASGRYMRAAVQRARWSKRDSKDSQF